MITARGARTGCETGINDGGYSVSGCLTETFTVAVYRPVGNPAVVTNCRQNLTVA